MKIGFLITAGLSSQRLKQKAILELNNRLVIEHVIDRCKSTKGVNEVVLCTSDQSYDDPFIEICRKSNLNIFRGDKDDVLLRLFRAAQKHKLDAFVSITADNPLFSIELAENMILLFNEQPYDYIFSSGFPIGMAPYFVNVSALNLIISLNKIKHTDIWGPYFDNENLFNICQIEASKLKFDEQVRLTLDYPEDYELIQSISNQFPIGYLPSMREIFEVLDNKISLLEINKNCFQRVLSSEVLEYISTFFLLNNKKIKKIVKNINKELKPTKTTVQINI